jgi:hypothetical protein
MRSLASLPSLSCTTRLAPTWSPLTRLVTSREHGWQGTNATEEVWQFNRDDHIEGGLNVGARRAVNRDWDPEGRHAGIVGPITRIGRQARSDVP